MRGEVLSAIYTCCMKAIAVKLLISLKRCKKITDRATATVKTEINFTVKERRMEEILPKNVCVSYFQNERIYLCMKINIISCSMLLSVIPNAHVSDLNGSFPPEIPLDSLVNVSNRFPCPGPHRVLLANEARGPAPASITRHSQSAKIISFIFTWSRTHLQHSRLLVWRCNGVELTRTGTASRHHQWNHS